MSVDHTQVVYYSGFSAFKNINVYESFVEVTNVTIPGEAYYEFTTAISVPERSDFVTILVQANESTGSPPRTPSALRWQTYPAASLISLALDTDPDGSGTLDCSLIVRINGTTVTFIVALFNPSPSSISFEPVNVGFKYATYTVE